MNDNGLYSKCPKCNEIALVSALFKPGWLVICYACGAHADAEDEQAARKMFGLEDDEPLTERELEVVELLRASRETVTQSWAFALGAFSMLVWTKPETVKRLFAEDPELKQTYSMWLIEMEKARR